MKTDNLVMIKASITIFIMYLNFLSWYQNLSSAKFVAKIQNVFDNVDIPNKEFTLGR